MKSTKEKLISDFKKRIEELTVFTQPNQKFDDRQVGILLGELQLAQVELEMQNDELNIAAHLLENERAKFAGFFNLAPLGYIILDHLGFISEINQIGASLLMLQKEIIINQRFQSFISTEDLESFYAFLHGMQTVGVKESTEIKLRLIQEKEIFVRLEGIAIANSSTNQIQYYVAMLDITEKLRTAQAALTLQNEKQKLILSTTLSAQEKERHKISSILHDSICQLLYGIRLNLQQFQINSDKDEFKNVHELLALAIKETRELSYELTPSVLRDFGFVAGVREMVDRLNSPQFKINLQINEALNKLSSDFQLSIFRIIQELLNNCIKHAEATKAEISVQLVDETITILVSDNGKGFEFDLEHSLSEGSGLRGIKNRIYLLNGELELKTGKSGSKITIKFKNEI